MFKSALTFRDTKQFNDLVRLNADAFSAAEFIDDIKYQGFERESFIIEAAKRISASQMIRLGLIGAIRGANFKKIKENSTKIDNDLVKLSDDGIVLRRATKSNDITVLRCTSAIPHWCAYFMGKAAVSKKIPSLECPASLQFPAAASLPMSKVVRLQHVRFSMHFSKLIKGQFNENIYMTMFENPIPLDQIPDELKLVLGTPDNNVDLKPTIEEVQKELGTALVKT
jgi:hypothetical protein